jgi:hypothetical protein
VVDGRRAAPLEDFGRVTDSESLAEVLDDPNRFGLYEINQALRAPYFILREQVSTSGSSTLSIDFGTPVPARIWPAEWPR